MASLQQNLCCLYKPQTLYASCVRNRSHFTKRTWNGSTPSSASFATMHFAAWKQHDPWLAGSPIAVHDRIPVMISTCLRKWCYHGSHITVAAVLNCLGSACYQLYLYRESSQAQATCCTGSLGTGNQLYKQRKHRQPVIHAAQAHATTSTNKSSICIQLYGEPSWEPSWRDLVPQSRTTDIDRAKLELALT